MSRYTGPTTRINRRFGMPIFAESKAMQKKPISPVSTARVCAAA